MRADDVQLAFLGVAQVFQRFLPDRHARIVLHAHVGDGLAEHLDLAGQGVQRVLFGILVEGAMADPFAGLGRGGLQGIALFPELLEGRGLGGAGAFIGRADVVHVVHRVGELRPEAHLVGQGLEDLVVAHRLAQRLDDLLHRVDLVVGIGAADRDVVALQRGGCGQHDVGPADGRGPPDVLADDGVQLAEGLQQPVQILLV